MKGIVSQLAMAVVKGSIELLLFFPPLLLLILYVLPEAGARWLWFTTLPLCYMAGYAVGIVGWLHKLYRLPRYACLVAIALLHSYVWFGHMPDFFYLLPIPWLQAYRGSRTAQVPWLEYFPGGYYVVGMAVYFIASFLLRYVPSFAPYQSLLTWCGIVSLALTLLMVNQSNLKQETLSAVRNPALAPTVLWQNVALITIVFAAVVLFALFRQFHEAILWLKELLLTALGAAFMAIPSMPTPEDQSEPLPFQPIDFGPRGEPSELLTWLEKVAYIFAYVVMAALLGFVLYRFFRALPGWLHRLFALLKSLFNQGEQAQSGVGYEDDVQNLMDWEELREGLHARFRGLLKGFGTREPKWGDLKDNRERVRFLYRAMLTVGVKAGFCVKPYFTPKETGKELDGLEMKHPITSEPVVSVYEKVRYGDKDVSDAQVAAAKQALERRKP